VRDDGTEKEQHEVDRGSEPNDRNAEQADHETDGARELQHGETRKPGCSHLDVAEVGNDERGSSKRGNGDSRVGRSRNDGDDEVKDGVLAFVVIGATCSRWSDEAPRQIVRSRLPEGPASRFGRLIRRTFVEEISKGKQPMASVAEDRGLLMNVAYRLLGSVAEAEDAVQDAYARWYAMSVDARDEIDSPTAWLVTVTTRICLDILGSARARRERYVGEWLPEPVPGKTTWTSQAATDRAIDPADRVSLDESLSMALLVVLESMTPAERVAFVLHDVFRYSFEEVGTIVGRSPEACRQLASSARRRVRNARRDEISAEDHALVVSAFQVALETGDLRSLLEILDPNATAIPDGGGLVNAAIEPIRGAETIARYLLNLYQLKPDLTFQLTTVNGRTGLVGRDGAGETLAVASVSIANGLIEQIWVIRNPAKLVGW
jgi:RNA polymerase sigma factor (sigma-70 family)